MTNEESKIVMVRTCNLDRKVKWIEVKEIVSFG
jgi:hypothetical protein